MNTRRLHENIREIQSRIGESASRVGRNAGDITLVAVTKTVMPEVIENLVEAGVKDIGENRVSDAMRKKERCAQAARWHMIGHLQRNKVRDALQVFDFFHSIDSVRLAKEIARRSDRSSGKVPVLLEVNASHEASKSGFFPANLEGGMQEIITLESLEILGFMTMAPFTADMSHCRECFRKLRSLADEMREKYPALRLPHLSMGMSRDFEVAVEEGATMVRIGTALFTGVV